MGGALPVRPHADRDVERDAQLGSAAHPGAEDLLHTLLLTGRDLEDYQISIDDGHGGVTVVRDQSTLTSEGKALVAYLKKFSKPARLK